MAPVRILSLGAGVQSTTLALMAAHGEIPPMDAAIFADTQAEPRAVYDHLARLMAPGVLPFPVLVVSKGSLKQEILDACAGKRGAWVRPPLFVTNHDGSGGMTNRQCTSDYKLDPIYRKVRELAGVKPRSRGPATVAVEQVIGISHDEAHRMKDARFRWIRNVYPLVDLAINRQDCEKKLAAWGWSAVKSACTFCPYHSDATWAAIKEHDPAAWAEALEVDRALRTHHGVAGVRGHAFLHSERQPLELVNFGARLARPKKAKQRRLYLPADDSFGNECEGMCGV
jgi:hypothetical protein